MRLNRLRELAGIPVLKEDTSVITNNNTAILFSDWAKGHITSSHQQLGSGSVFSKNVDINSIAKAIQTIQISKEGGVFQVKVPGAGFDLVLPIEKAKQLPDAKMEKTTKQERGQDIEVPLIRTSAPLKAFSTDVVSIVIRPSTVEYLPDDVKDNEKIVQATKQGKVYSVLSAWPGSEIPPASQWNGQYAVIVPGGQQ